MKTFPCNSALRSQIKRNLTDFETRLLDPGPHKRAAVALTVVDYRGDGGLYGLADAPQSAAAVILTKRAGSLTNHAGQWAFPGGSVDPGESTGEAALRELEEEVGLSLSKDRILGFLDDFVTRSGFHITPVVIWAGPTKSFIRNNKEVASIHRIPCTELFREDAPFFENGEGGGPILFMPVGKTCIASPTAAMLYQFREVALAGGETRVAHYEQPWFAWS